MRKFRGTGYVHMLAAMFAVILVILLSPDFVSAQDVNLDTVGEASGLAGGNLVTIIGTIIRVFIGILGVVFLSLMIYAGALWMGAGGNPEMVEKAKKVMVRAVIGLIITLSAFAITTFIFNALQNAGLLGTGTGGLGTTPGAPPFSNSLGNGGIRDHYPERNATDVPRNAKIIVTFKSAMDLERFIDGYDANGTPLDVSDDSVGGTPIQDGIAFPLNDNLVTIYPTDEGEGAKLTSSEVSVSYTDDLQTLVFVVPLLGSSVEDTLYTVELSDRLVDAEGDQIIDNGGYIWNFTVGTQIDLTPPYIQSVIPIEGRQYARNIVVQINFSEAVDPVSSSGIFNAGDANSFNHIEVTGDLSGPVSGNYAISNGYKTVTFITTDICGTNSCGETLFCLPASENIRADIHAATPGSNPPQVDFYPYDGVADVAGNALDGNNDGEAGDDFGWDFRTNNAIELAGPEIESVTPDILAEDVPLDQAVTIVWNDILMANSATSDNISFVSRPEHELWFTTRLEDIEGPSSNMVSSLSLPHGILLESTEDQSYLYDLLVTQGVRNQYQNCYNPAIGPDGSGGECVPQPGGALDQAYCFNGDPVAEDQLPSSFISP